MIIIIIIIFLVVVVFFPFRPYEYTVFIVVASTAMLDEQGTLCWTRVEELLLN